MTAYRAGQRVRIEWPDGSAVEGTVVTGLGTPWVRLESIPNRVFLDSGTVTVLAEPRPEEPMQLGAVVEAGSRGYVGRLFWVRLRTNWTVNSRSTGRQWSDLIDPVVLSEGWTP